MALRNAAGANGCGGGSAWSNADEGGGRKALPPPHSFAPVASAAPHCPRCRLLYNKLPSQTLSVAYVYYLFTTIIYYLVYIYLSPFNHFVNHIK